MYGFVVKLIVDGVYSPNDTSSFSSSIDPSMQMVDSYMPRTPIYPSQSYQGPAMMNLSSMYPSPVSNAPGIPYNRNSNQFGY